MLSYLTLIEQTKRYHPEMESIKFLVSGEDLKIRDIVFRDICNRIYLERKNLLIIDDLGNQKTNVKELSKMGFYVRNGLEEDYGFSDILDIRTRKGLFRFREMLDTMKYGEREKQKLVSYLHLVYQIEKLAAGREIELDMEVLNSYGAVMLVEAKLSELLTKGKINKEQQRYLLSKYMEVSDIGADFEHSFYLFIPFMGKKDSGFLQREREAYIFSLKDFSRDIVMKKLFFQMLEDVLEEVDGEKTEIIILDGGVGRNHYLPGILKDFSSNIHMFTADLFSMEDVEKALNYFNAKIYSRHSMISSEKISNNLGKVLVCRQAYMETKDRKLSANKPLDILLGTNKVEAYTTNAPVWEPKYSKEMINNFLQGQGIVEFFGNSSVFKIE